jgi:hypothetical protein
MPYRGRGRPTQRLRALIASLAEFSVLVTAACGSLQGLAGCGASGSESPVPTTPSIRTIQLDQRWTGQGGSICFYEIRTYDGGFLVLGRTVGEPSVGDPWHAALRGFSRMRVLDETGREYSLSGTDGRPGHVAGMRVDGFLTPMPQAGKGDLLTGIHQLTFQVDNILEKVEGPWIFDKIPVRSGPLTATATAAARELRLFDLVVQADGFSVGFMELGGHDPPFVGIRSAYNEFALARDDKGNTYAVVRPERIGSSALLYMKFAPALPGDAKLTITLDRIFVSTDRTWRGSLYLP